MAMSAGHTVHGNGIVSFGSCESVECRVPWQLQLQVSDPRSKSARGISTAYAHGKRAHASRIWKKKTTAVVTVDVYAVAVIPALVYVVRQCMLLPCIFDVQPQQETNSSSVRRTSK